MKVRLRTTMAGPKGVRHQGEVIDVPPAEAEFLINTKAAEPVLDKGTRETATLAVVENASLEPRPVKRKIVPRRAEATND